jgi:UDP-GlcNAc:undecaprenyl-phosphate GlcNAc-1-phosphate transferase
MPFPILFIFSVMILCFEIALKNLTKYYIYDNPNYRKKHTSPISPIGGLIFGPLFLAILWFSGLAPNWYLIGGLITIILGFVDDNYSFPWQGKLLVQFCLVIYLVSLFWGRFDTFTFYSLTFTLSQFQLLGIFLIWFIGIFNAINLIDGLDGLAASFVLIISLGLGISGPDSINTLSFIFAIILLSYLVYNQRPAKIFMGDVGSLLLGFHIAVLPLLANNWSTTSNIAMTPIILLSSYLIADTSRVFFTRIISKKNPMNADTIHFHHLVIQNSGSYLASITSILIITIITIIMTVFSYETVLPVNVMILHFSFILLFILTPPVQTYVPLLTKITSKFYNWQKKDKIKKDPFIYRTLFMIFLFLGLLISIFLNYSISIYFNLFQFISLIIISSFLFNNRGKIISCYVIQLTLIIFFTDIFKSINIDLFIKIFTTSSILSYTIFLFERRLGCDIGNFSTLDVLVVLITFSGLILSYFQISISIWYFLIIFSIWFSSSFILRRIFFNSN